jgi:hypothetical protein
LSSNNPTYYNKKKKKIENLQQRQYFLANLHKMSIRADLIEEERQQQEQHHAECNLQTSLFFFRNEMITFDITNQTIQTFHN